MEEYIGKVNKMNHMNMIKYVKITAQLYAKAADIVELEKGWLARGKHNDEIEARQGLVVDVEQKLKELKGCVDHGFPHVDALFSESLALVRGTMDGFGRCKLQWMQG